MVHVHCSLEGRTLWEAFRRGGLNEWQVHVVQLTNNATGIGDMGGACTFTEACRGPTPGHPARSVVL
jgi:hypothetical protein